MKFTPATFKLGLAAVAALLGFLMQYGLVPPEFAPVAAVVSTFLAGIVTPPTKKAPEDV